MKDLDELQTKLQAKLYTDSSTHRPYGVLYSQHEKSSYILDHYPQEIAGDNMNDSDKEYQDMNQLSGISKPDNVSCEIVENPSSIPNRECDDIKDKAATSDDKLVENSPKISQTLMKQEDTSCADITVHPPIEDVRSNVMDDAVVEGSSRDSVQYPSSSQDSDENIGIYTVKETSDKSCSSASDLEDCNVGSDSLEDRSYLPSVQVFTQERDSWLSSTEEEEETKKSPLNSNTYSLINNTDQHGKEELSSNTGQISSHSITENTKITVTDNELSSPFFHKDAIDDNSNELLHYKCAGETLVSNTSNSIPLPQTHANLSYFPNFFMPREQLEHSMRALRLNSKLSHSYAASDFKQGQSKLLQRTCEVTRNTGASKTVSQYSQKQVKYKAKKDGQPPIPSAEIERIARIFTSKDS